MFRVSTLTADSYLPFTVFAVGTEGRRLMKYVISLRRNCLVTEMCG